MFFVRRDELIAKISPDVKNGDDSSINDFLTRLTLYEQKNLKVFDADAADDESDKLQELPQEPLDLNEAYLCLFCKTVPKNVAVHPCKHMAYCVACWDQYDKYKRDNGETVTCPLCKMTVVQSERLFV